jgi:hypothetical protein
MTAACAEIGARALGSGENLSAGAIQWGRRESPARSVALTERDLRLMAMLYDANYLSASQLVLLGWGEYLGRAGERRLKRLYDDGYVDRFRPTRAAGRAQWNYRLSERGFSALAEHDIAPVGRTYTPAALTSISYAEHDLQLAALVIHIAQEATRERTGALMDRMPFTWKGPRTGRVEAVSHGPVERSPAAVLPAGTALYHARSRRGYLEPDATLIGGSCEDLWAVLIEYDRTDRPHKQIDRLRRYDHWMLDGWRHSRFASHAIPPSVIFLTSRERPLRRLIETADNTFSAWYGRDDAGPREGTHPARERVVFTSREHVLAGDWAVLRTPSLPPELRKQPGVCSPHSVVYDLPSLFAARTRRQQPSSTR